MPRLAEEGRKGMLSLDSDVELTHYRLQKLGEQKLDLEKAEVKKLPAIKDAGMGSAPEDERKEPREIVQKMNDLFSGDISEAVFIGAVTTWKGHLLANETLAAQAKNNTEEQFELGNFKEAFADIVIYAQDAQNRIADQLLKDDRIFGVMQRILGKMVGQQFQDTAR